MDLEKIHVLLALRKLVRDEIARNDGNDEVEVVISDGVSITLRRLESVVDEPLSQAEALVSAILEV